MNTISGHGVKRKFEEVGGDLNAGSRKIRKIKGDMSVHMARATAESAQLVFHNSYECIASYLSIDALINFSQTSRWAYTKLSGPLKALGRDGDIQEIWGPIEYLKRFAMGSTNVFDISPHLREMASHQEAWPRQYDKSASFYEKVKSLVFEQRAVSTIRQGIISSLQFKWQSESHSRLPFDALVFFKFLGINPPVSNRYYRDPIMSALTMGALKGSVNKIKFLTLNVDNEVAIADLFDELASASFLPVSEKIEKMQFLLDAGANLSLISPFHISVLKELEVVEFLIAKGINPNAQNNGLEGPPLHKAVKSANLDVVRVLYEYSKATNVQDRFDNALLHYVVMRSQVQNNSNKLDILKFLLRKGENPNIKNRVGRTPLHIAVENDPQEDIIQCLLEAGADPHLQDLGGQTALDLYTHQVGRRDVIMQLLNYDASTSWWNSAGRLVDTLYQDFFKI